MTTETYRVIGMTCSHCVNAVSTELRQLEGVESVDVDLDAGTATVVSAAPLDVAAVAVAVDEAGYELAP